MSLDTLPTPTSLARWSASLPRRGVQSAREWLALPWVREVLALFLASRVAFVVVTYVAYVLIQAPKYSTTSVGVSNLLHSWQQWDAVRYITIATRGYTSASTTAFFPLYPLLIAAITAPWHGQGAYAVGLILSNLAFLGALILLRTLVVTRWSDGTASRALVYLTVFPTALYTFAPYNESQFLLFALGCFVALERRRWAAAGILGALAVLTRAAGLLLLIPYAVVWWQSWRLRVPISDARAGPRTISRDESSTSATPASASAHDLAWALLLPGVLGLYAAYCASRFGDPLAFAHAQAAWNRVLAWPWQSLWWQVIGLVQAASASFFQAHDLLDLGATLLFAALLALGWRRLPRAQSLYFAALLVLVMIEPGGVHTHLRDPLTSNGRFVLEMFPGFITLALVTDRRPLWHQAIVIVSAMLLATLSIVFILGRWLV